jgi:tetratricopeptide (TPR) repeat protein
MAEKWTHAFGRYLKTLRERRGLSLQDVASLSQAFTETLNKGYLSRCENGHQSFAFPKMIALSRIYEVGADVLLERLELDMELDRVGGPATDGLTFAELTRKGSEALNEGLRWDAYGYLRHALLTVADAPVSRSFRDSGEQASFAYMNCSTAARGLGRYRFALHELQYVRSTGAMSDGAQPVLLERLSQAYRGLGQLELARISAEDAVDAVEKLGESKWRGYVYSNRATQAHCDAEYEIAASYYQKSFDAFRQEGQQNECARALNNLAQAFYSLGRYGAARRALVSADAMMQNLNQHRTQALSYMLMGELDDRDKQHEKAAKLWREAAEIGRRLNDKELRFKAEFLLFKQAKGFGNEAVARSIQRRLSKLAQWVPKSTPELQEFARLAS